MAVDNFWGRTALFWAIKNEHNDIVIQKINGNKIRLLTKYILQGGVRWYA